MKTNIEYSLASSSWAQEEIDAIQGVVDKGFYSMGTAVKDFESQFAQHFGSQYAVMVNSGSSANLLAVAALFYTKENKLKAGDEVIVPAVSWSTTYMPLQQYGLKVKFVDIDLHTLNFDLDALEKAITPDTKLIFAVNLLGNPNDYDRINAMIDGKDIILLEDNCESMGAKYKDKDAGTFGAMGTFSTFFSHHMSTMEGGMITTNDEELYHILLSLRSHGWTRHLPKENKVTGTKSDNAFEESFKFVLPGYNVRPVEMSGAIGIEQLKKLNSFVDYRRKNAEAFVSLLGKDQRFIIQEEIGQSSWFGFSILINPAHCKESRQDILDRLNAHGVETRPIVSGNFLKNEALKYFDYEVSGEMKNADYIDKYGFFIGNQQMDIRDKIKALSEVI